MSLCSQTPPAPKHVCSLGYNLHNDITACSIQQSYAFNPRMQATLQTVCKRMAYGHVPTNLLCRVPPPNIIYLATVAFGSQID
jgi:hypothetical protein